MSDQVIIAIIVALTAIVGSILTYIAVSQANRLKSQELALTKQGEEQERQAATITRISDEAKERAARRIQERESDRAEAKERRDEYRTAADYYKAEWEVERGVTRKQREEITGLTQQVIDHIKDNDRLQAQYSKSDTEHAIDIERLKSKTKEFENLEARLIKSEELVAAHQEKMDALIVRFDADLISLSATYAKTVQALQTRIDALELERVDFLKEIAELRKEIQAIRNAPLQPDPTDPGARAPIPGDFEPQVALPKTGTDY